MIGLLIVGGITGLLAFAAHKTNPSPSSAPATATASASPVADAAHPANSGLEGIFSTPEMEKLYSSATQSLSYDPRVRAVTSPSIPIQPGTGGAISPVQTKIGSATVAAKPTLPAQIPPTVTRIIAPMRQQRFSLL